ncbi:MAG TPA: M48 family metalloprotease [Burkholderiales bacterium]|nr:M48 family metalloprotease [Burkholderiales bacterium]
MRFLAWLLAASLACVPRAFAQDTALPRFSRSEPQLDLAPRAAPLPDLGEASGADLSLQDERRIGESVMQEIRRDPDYLDDPEVAALINGIGAQLAAAVPGLRQDFEFFVIRDSSINAFALPGGFIGVHTGLIAASETESEIASVLAHEMGHVMQRHIARQMGIQKRMQTPMMIAMAAALLLARSRPDLAGGSMMAVQGGAIQSQLAYSREFEQEADRVGFQTLAASGYDTRAMATFFQKLLRNDTGSVPVYLRTHPVTTERVAEAQDRAAHTPYRQHVDSLEYHLVRAKVRAEAGDPYDAVKLFTEAMNDRRFASEPGARYGLAVALLRVKEPKRAEAEVARLRADKVASPMIETLAARVRIALRDQAGALAILKAAQARYPYFRSILYSMLGMLNDLGQFDDMLSALAEPLRLYPRDPKLKEAQAKAYAGLGKRFLQHQSLAEFYVLQGSLPAAIDQLEFAQSSGDGNFYELSVVDARLKALRAELARETQDKKNDKLR